MNDEDEVRETIPPETAHALVDNVGHSAKWRETALSIGSNGLAKYGDDTVLLEPPHRSPSCRSISFPSGN